MKVAIITYSTYGHINVLAKSIQEGVEKTGLATKVDRFQVPETLSEDVLAAIHAPPKDASIPIATVDTLVEYDAFLFGIPTRFGNLPAQFLDFFDKTGKLWAEGSLYHKPVGVFVSTGGQQGGQETTIRSFLTYVSHHGLIYIPLGYGAAFPHLTNFDEIHGGTPYGAGTIAGTDGSKQPNETELAIAKIQGESFTKSASKFVSTKSEEPTAVATPEKPTEEKVKPAPASAPAAKRNATPSTPEKEDSSSCIKCVIV
ncbi:flavoprotein-like protein Ycp4p [[Candida] railenensis]|uniref:Flavoprotein-like protein Ycp4p n=1 Tax=[Candida] railenensis TaxID=45579 RepID=A0A9P0QN51_9ASCO|nr:flavoprotein-like protein Ycp4p [[Candida] railenensis]